VDRNLRRVKKTIITTLQAFVTLAVLVVVFRDPQKRHDMADTIRNADPLWLFAGFACYGIVEMLAGIRWHLLLRVQGIHLGWPRLFMLLIIGVAFNYLIPGGTGGDVVKVFYLLKETPGKRSAALLTVLMDRLVGLMRSSFSQAFSSPRAGAGSSARRTRHSQSGPVSSSSAAAWSASASR
jgi:uncharacterized protein (TIRG00374 family)